MKISYSERNHSFSGNYESTKMADHILEMFNKNILQNHVIYNACHSLFLWSHQSIFIIPSYSEYNIYKKHEGWEYFEPFFISLLTHVFELINVFYVLTR